MKWVQIREPVEFTAPISGTFIPNDYTEINNKGNGDSLQFVGLFLGTLKLPPRNNRIETSPGKLGEDDASGNKEDAYAEQQNEPKIDSNKKEVEENSHTVVEVNIQVNIRKIEGTYDLLDIEGIIENGDVILSDELLVKLYKVAEHYVGPDGDINKVDEIQIEGVIQGVITQI